MLGFGGHFSTRSRRYSVTLTTLRSARRAWRRDSSEDQTLLAGTWRYRASGHHTLGDTLLAATAARTRQQAAEAARSQRRAERLSLTAVA